MTKLRPQSIPGTQPARLGLALAAALLLLYFPALNHPFLFDDHTAILTNTTLHDLTSWKIFWGPAQTTAAGRPLLNLSLALNHAVSGPNPWSYRLLNIFIHTANALLLCVCTLESFLLFTRRARNPRRTRAAALSAVIIWTFHPIQTESITYVVQRAESLAVLFQLLCFLAWLRYQRESSLRWIVAGTAASCAAMLSKETSVTLPVFLLASDLLLNGVPRAANLRRRLAFLAPVAASWLILAALLLSGARDESAGFGLKSVTWNGYFLSQVAILWHYIFLIIWPAKLTLDYGWPQGILNARSIFFISLNVAAALAALHAIFTRRRLQGALALAWFCILAPTSSIAPIADLCFEHRVYLAMYFPVFGFAWILTGLRLPSRNRAFALIVALLILLTAARNHDYRSEIAIYQDSALKAPRNWRPHSNLAHLILQAGDPQSALAHARRATALAPDQPDAQFNLGDVLFTLGDLDGARAAFTKSAEGKTNPSREYNNLGLIELDLGNRAEGARLLQEAVRLDPNYADALNNLGTLHAEDGRRNEARDCFTRALAIDPGHAGAVENLAILESAP